MCHPRTEAGAMEIELMPEGAPEACATPESRRDGRWYKRLWRVGKIS